MQGFFGVGSAWGIVCFLEIDVGCKGLVGLVWFRFKKKRGVVDLGICE